ncbi:MAG: DnaD domain protein [Ruminococcus sp.]|nr:DnaD domain protein [Ruminococcus sp.]
MNNFWKCKKYVTNNIFIKKARSLNLSLEEFLMLMYFDNDYNGYLDMEALGNNLGLKLDSSYVTFNSLLSKKIISVETIKDIEGRMIEKVSLDNFYNMIGEEEKEVTKEEIKTDIYSTFETEFGRTLSGMEYEIINAWLEKGFSEELIIGALREAVYNGVKNLRYIDKILYEWHKKGFKNLEDVNKHLVTKSDFNEIRKDIFDYNWLDDEDGSNN